MTFKRITPIEELYSVILSYDGQTRSTADANLAFDRLLEKGDNDNLPDNFFAASPRVQKRIEFIKNCNDTFAHQFNTKNTELKALSQGKESLVLQHGDQYVMKIRTGDPYYVPNSQHVLQPLLLDHSPEHNIAVSFFDKVKVVRPSLMEVYSIYFKLAQDGVIFADPSYQNYGEVTDNGNPRMVVIDSGAVRDYQSKRDILKSAFYITAKPICYKTEFLNRPARALRSGILKLQGKKTGLNIS